MDKMSGGTTQCQTGTCEWQSSEVRDVDCPDVA